LEQLDIGFRVLRLDSSNLRDVYYKPQDIKQEDLELFSDNLKEDRTPEDILFQILLDWGLPLSLKIKNKIIAGKKVFLVADNSLYACFDKGIDETFAREVSKDKPLRIVFRDSGFKDDTAKTNVQQLLKQLSPETEVRVF
jgi:adenine-specific DNA-methyltransferase